MSTHSRVPAGVTAGGQFSTSARAEAEVALDPSTYQAHANALAARLAATVGAEKANEIEVSTSVSCGAPAGARWLSTSVDVPDSPMGEQVSVGAYLLPDGRTSELGVEITWNVEETQDSTLTRDGSSLPWNPHRSEENLDEHVAQVRGLARQQRALDVCLNEPQRTHRAKYIPSSGRYDILLATAAVDSRGRTVVEFSDGRGTRRDKVLVRLDECRHVESLAVDTHYGLLAVGEDDREKVAATLDRNLTLELVENLGTDSDTWGVASLSRRMARALPQDD
jgi:hypothetical protein